MVFSRLACSFVVMAALCAGTIAHALDYKPGFACPRPTDSDPLATAICSSSEMARSELEFEQVYYAHRLQDGPTAYQQLKRQADTYDKALRAACAIPLPGRGGPTLSNYSIACYETMTEKQAAEWASSLSGDAADEARRPLDQHIAIQQRLISAGYLQVPSGQADGVYGEGTREAIRAWQKASGLPESGAVSDSEMLKLMSSMNVFVAQRGSEGPHPTLNTAPTGDLLSRILKPDMLDIQQAYLETLTGPAKRITPESKATAALYIVDGCELTAMTKIGTVVAYDLKLSSSCSVDLTPFVGQEMLVTGRTTFGDISANLGGDEKLIADCLYLCGNAVDPEVGLTYTGSHSSGFIQIAFMRNVDDDVSAKASEAWLATMPDPDPAGVTQPVVGYVEKGTYNCERTYDSQGIAAFTPVPVEEVYIGGGDSPLDDVVARDCSQSTANDNAAAPTSTPPQPAPAPRPDLFKVGNTIRFDGFDLTVESVQERGQVGSEFLNEKASEGGVLVAVTYSLKNTSSAPMGFMDQPNLKLIDPRGTTYSNDTGATAAFSTENDFNNKIVSDLNPGITVHDGDVFEISKDAFDPSTWSIVVEGQETHPIALQ